MRRYLHRTLREQESVADLVGSVCGDLLAEGIEFEYRGEAQFHGWLREVVVNKIRGRLRFVGAQKRDHDRRAAATPSEVDGLVVDPESPSQQAMLHEDLGLLDRALAQLDAQHRELIVRAHLRGESRERIAADLGTNAGAVRKRLTRAMVKLAGELDRLQRGDGK